MAVVMKTALCYNLKFSVRTYLTSHQEGHLFLVPNIHNLAILSFTERQTATHSPSCIVPIIFFFFLSGPRAYAPDAPQPYRLIVQP